MKTSLLTLFLSVSLISLQAQITIDSSDFGVAGDTLTVGNFEPTSSINVGGTGSQTWTFVFSVDDINTLKFEDPANTDRAALFSNSDIAIERLEDTLFFKKTATEFSLDGLAGDISGIQGAPPLSIALDINGDVKQVEFPSTLNSSFTDQAVIDTTVDCASVGAGNFCSQARVKRRYLITSEIDAHGSLEHSGGNYPNTIRQYYIERTIDSIWANLPFIGGTMNLVRDIDSTNHIYRWFAKDEQWPVLTAFADAQGGDMTAVEFQVDTLIAYITASSAPLCAGECNATATIQGLGESGPFTYAWPASANSQTSATGTGLCDGTYVVTITDAASNTTTVDVEVNDPAELAVSGSIQGVAVENDGAIDITASGGNGAYTYTWTGPDGFTATTADISDLADGEYFVTIVDNNGCELTESFLVELTGTDQIAANSLKLFPNPANTELNVVSGSTINSIRLFDMIGNQVSIQQATSNQVTIETSGLSSGIYMIEVISDNQTSLQKITIKH